MFRAPAILFACLAWACFSACADNFHSKEKVQEAILDRLQSHSGLDLKSLDVNTTAVTFDKNSAVATVSFHPKGDPSLNSGMTMKYTLEYRDKKWVVTNVGDTHGQPAGAAGMPGGSTLPPGHPRIGGGNKP